MSAGEHARAVRQAERTERELKLLFARLGSKQHPRGRILTAYRVARRALRGDATDLGVLGQVLAELRMAVQETAYSSLSTAGQAGMAQARTITGIYGLPTPTQIYTPATEYDAWMAAYDAQAAQLRALAVAGDESAILGDDGRVGAMSPAPIIREGARWLTIAAAAGMSYGIDASLNRARAREEWQRQAVAAIDGRTTDCCLRVHGQTVGMKESFSLSGTPRFADKMKDSPFHYYCRTVWTLVRAEDAKDRLTQQMQEAASYELEQRALTGKPGAFGPASATSRRTGVQVARKRSASSKTSSAVPNGEHPDALLKSWVNGAHRKKSVLLKRAVKEELGVRGLVMNRNKYTHTAAEINASRASVRSMYDATQASLKGKKTITLYRGVKSEIRSPGVVESWTTDLKTARKFNGHDVMRMEIPVDRIFMYSGGPGWANGRYGEQFEYMVLPEAPQ